METKTEKKEMKQATEKEDALVDAVMEQILKLK